VQSVHYQCKLCTNAPPFLKNSPVSLSLHVLHERPPFLINENYSNEEKIEIIETLWRIVYVDGKMDQYEHYLMNKLKNLLRLSHDQLIDAKLKVLHSR